MKYIDDKIQFDIYNTSITSSRQNPFALYFDNSTNSSNLMFNGRCYNSSGDTSIHIDCTDIIQSFAFDNDAFLKPLKSYNKPVEHGIIDTIACYVNTQNYQYSQDISVAYVNHYNHIINDIYSCPILDPSPAVYPNYRLNNLLQGTNDQGVQQVLLPRIPYLPSTSEYGFGSVYQMFNYNNPRLFFNGRVCGYIYLYAQNNTNIYYDNLYNMFFSSSTYTEWDCIDATYVQPQAGQGGSGYWNNDTAGGVLDVSGQAMTISICDASGDTIKHGSLFNSIKYNEQYEYSYDTSGCAGFEMIKIGNMNNNIYITTSDPLFCSARRNFTIKCVITRQVFGSLDIFYIEGVSVINNDYRNTSIYTTLDLGNNPIAEIDMCPADWYLEWIDNYDSFQSQPFYGKTIYTENYTRTEIENYDRTRRLTYVGKQGTFSVNSGWISSKVYPIYQSIYTSPYLLLYDVKNNKSYNVICTDESYEEKKYIRQKEMINLSLNLELNKRIDRIY